MYEWLATFFDAAEILGTVAFAAAGAMIAIDRELDMFGVLFLGITAAVGGGISRDLFLGITPPGAFRNSVYVAVAAVTSLAVFLFAWLDQRQYTRHHGQMDRAINLLDAIGLGVFGVIGVESSIGMNHGGNMFLCVFTGMITGIGGGILRDVFCSTVPAVLKKRIYAVAVIVGCSIYYGMRRMGMPLPLDMVVGMLVIVVIRLCASRFRWDLPAVHPKAEE